MKETAYALIALVLLALTYFGSYYAMLTAETGIGTDGIAKPVYRFGGNATDAFYGPAFELDRQMRPERWAVTMLFGCVK